MSRVFRWGVLGASGIAREKFLPALADSDTSSGAIVASRSLERARELAAQFDVPSAVGSYQEVLNSNVDAVYISLPNSLHVDWIVAALEAGKPVLCEKPMVLDTSEAERVLEASRRTNTPVSEGFMWRYHPRTIALQQMITEGDIGEVVEVRVWFSFPLVGMMTSDNIRIADGKGAGAIMDVGSYVVSAARLLFGAEPRTARGFLDVDDGLGIDVGFAGALEFDDDRFASVSWSLQGGYGAGYTVIGTAGSIEVPHGFIPGAGGMTETTWLVRVAPSGERSTIEFAPANHFAAQVDAFSDAVMAGRQPRYGAEDALGNARALDLIRAVAMT